MRQVDSVIVAFCLRCRGDSRIARTRRIKLEKYWLDLTNHYENIYLDNFTAMPDHFHGIIILEQDDERRAIRELPLQRRDMLLPKIIGRFKMTSAKEINLLLGKSGTAIWQRNYYEHIIRNESEHFEISEYIANNRKNWRSDHCETAYGKL